MLAEQRRIIGRAKAARILGIEPSEVGNHPTPPSPTAAMVAARKAARNARSRTGGRTGSERVAITEIIDRDGPACYLCNRDLAANETELEHVIPLVKGGEHTASNLAIACQPCNSEKHARIVSFDIATRRPNYSYS